MCPHVVEISYMNVTCGLTYHDTAHVEAIIRMPIQEATGWYTIAAPLR